MVWQGPGRGPFQAVEGREVVALPLVVVSGPVVSGQQSLVIGHLGKRSQFSGVDLSLLTRRTRGETAQHALTA